MNNSKDTRKDYESPVTKKVQVEMEGYLCGSADITNPEGEYGEIQTQKTSENFDIVGGTDNTTGDDWDTGIWNQQ